MSVKMDNHTYVLATKWSDGDPYDQWCVGFYDGVTEHNPPRYLVVDGSGRQFRGNGFRRVQPISFEFGTYLIEHKHELTRSLWDYLKDFDNANALDTQST